MDDDARIVRRRDETPLVNSLLPRPGPKLYSALIWWAFGLYALFAANAPYTPSLEAESSTSIAPLLCNVGSGFESSSESLAGLIRRMQFGEHAHDATESSLRLVPSNTHHVPAIDDIVLRVRERYDELMSRAVFSDEGRFAERELVQAQREFDRVNVFFWRWRAPYDRLVPDRQRRLRLAEEQFLRATRERDALVSEAKASVGIWSRYGVAEARQRFWESFQWGKDFAKRMTFWDVVFGIGGRDEELYVTLLRWLGQIMMNFTVGLVAALVSFAYTLFWLVWEYKASMVSGVLFYAVAISGASAMVGLFIGGMYATAVGGVYMAVQSRAARLENRGGGQRQYVRHTRYHQE